MTVSNPYLKSVVVTLVIMASSLGAAVAQIPSTIAFQGLLTDENGVPLPSGDYSISFRVYNTAEGGTALWTEVQSVSVVDGIANATLGRINPIDLPFDTQYWLGITIGQNPTELSPRLQMSAVAYSLTTKGIPDGIVTSAKIADGTVTSAKIADGAVTASKIADGAVAGDNIADGSITSQKLAANAVGTANIADAAVVTAKISTQGAQAGEALIMTNQGLDWGAPSGQGVISEVAAGPGLDGGGMTGKVTLQIGGKAVLGTMIADRAVGTEQLANNAVTTLQIAADAVTSPKIPVGEIRLDRLSPAQADAGEIITFNGTVPVWSAFTLAPASVGTNQLADGAVTGAKLFTTGATVNEVLTYNGNNIVWSPVPGAGAGSVGTTELANDAVTTLKIANGAVTGNKLADAAVATATIADASVTAAKVAPDAVTTVKIANGAVTTAKIDDLAVGAGQLAANSVIAAKIANGAVTLPKIDASSGSNNQVLTINAGAAVWADAGGLGPGSVGETELANNSVGPDKIKTGAVTAGKIAGSAVGNAALDNGSVTNDKIAPGTIDPLNKLNLSGASNGEFLVYNGGVLDWTNTIPGDLNVIGDVSKGGGSFKIDHPLDPENKFLYHSFVESDDMMNIYSGNVDLDADGRAVVELPEWFEPLNKDYRYQLTCLGGYAPVFIEKEIENGRFTIAGGQPNLRVSWQITAVRDDAWARKNRIQVEVEKPAELRGTLLHPDVNQ